MTRSVSFVALLLGLLSAAAQAEERTFFEQPYVALRGGWSNLRDLSIDYQDDSRTDRAVGFDNGWVGALAVGVQPRDWLRVETELSHREHDVNLVMPGSAASGSMSVGTGMVNAYLELPTASRFRPYVGVGLGAARVTQDSIGADGVSLSDDSAWAFAYQAMLGVSAEVAPRWRTSLEYRYLGTSDPIFRDREGALYDGSVRAHALMLGVSWTFR